jgi:6-phosphogluconate dehydrogenase
VLKKDQEFTGVSGAIGENKTGQWTVEAARDVGVPVETMELALNIRAQSREDGGNYATKLVALLRGEFGGHEVKRVDHE